MFFRTKAYWCKMAKRSRISCYVHDERDKDQILSRLERIRLTLPVNSSTRDVLLRLLDFYDDNFVGTRTQPQENKQIVAVNPDMENQLFISEQQQLDLLVRASIAPCMKCRDISWKLQDSTMKGHVLCSNLVCSNCKHVRRWLSSSIVRDRYAVNAR